MNAFVLSPERGYRCVIWWIWGNFAMLCTRGVVFPFWKNSMMNILQLIRYAQRHTGMGYSIGTMVGGSFIYMHVRSCL